MCLLLCWSSCTLALLLSFTARVFPSVRGSRPLPWPALCAWQRLLIAFKLCTQRQHGCARPQTASHRKLKNHQGGPSGFVPRYKQQLSQAIERERSLERDRVQLGLDWQRRCDDIERDQIQRSEALIQGLTEARDQVCVVLHGAVPPWSGGIRRQVWGMYSAEVGLIWCLLTYSIRSKALSLIDR